MDIDIDSRVRHPRRLLRPAATRALVYVGAVCALFFARTAGATPPPTITSITVTSYSTGDNHSIALPQTIVPTLEVDGTNFFQDGSTPGSILQPAVILRRAGFTDKYFFGASDGNTWGGDNTAGWIRIGNVNLSTYPTGSFDIAILRQDHTTAVAANAIQFLPQQTAERLVRRGGFGGAVNKVVPIGNLIYLNSGPRFVVLDATDEMHPVELGSIDLLTPILDFQIQGHYAFVCAQGNVAGGGSNGFCVVDLASSAAPQLVWSSNSLLGVTSSASDPNSHIDPERVWLNGSWAYVASGSSGIYAFNISNPVSPQYAGSILTSAGRSLLDGLGNGRGAIEIVGSYLYGWSYAGPAPAYLRVYQLGVGAAPPTPVTQVQCSIGGTVQPNDAPVSMAVGPGVLAYVTAGQDNGYTPTLSLWNIQNPAAPTLTSQTPLFRPVSGLAIASGQLFAAEDESWYQDPIYHVWASPWDSLGELTEYPDNSRGLLIYDIATDPANPALLATLKTHGSVYGLDASASRVYLHDHGEGMIIVDHSSPSAPVRLGGYYSPSAIRDVARNGDLLYVSDQYNGFTVLNTSNPDRPTVIGVYQVNHVGDPDLQGSWGIAYSSGRVYLAIGDGVSSTLNVVPSSGIDVVDVSDPSHPALIQAYHPPDCATFRGLEIDGQLLHAGGMLFSGCSSDCGAIQPQFWNLALDPSDGTVSSIAGSLPVSTIVVNPQTVGSVTYTEGGIVDQTNPTAPVLVSSDSCGVAIALDGNHVEYVAGPVATPPAAPVFLNPGGLFARDISIPANPTAPTPCLGDPNNTGGQAIAHNRNGRLLVDGQLTFLAGAYPSLFLCDTSTDPTSPRLVASLDPFYEHPPLFGVNAEGPLYDSLSSCLAVSLSGNASMLKVFEPLSFAADRAGNYRSNYGRRIAQGLMTIEHATTPRCAADFNGVGGLNVQDIFDFLSAWFASDPRADFNHQNGITVQDIFDFLSAWFVGC